MPERTVEELEALLDEACHLLEGSCIAIEGLLLDKRLKDGHPRPADGARSFLKRLGREPYQWPTLADEKAERERKRRAFASAPTGVQQGGTAE
jgi:hypothetical protein